MKVILQKDIENLGDAGDIKEVAAGYARNYLLPKKMVILANEKSKKAIEHQEKIVKIKKLKRKKQNETLAEKISGSDLVLNVKVGEEGKLFGSVTSIDIAKKLKEMGYEIDKRRIILAEPIKNIGEYQVEIKLDEGLTTTVNVFVDQEK